MFKYFEVVKKRICK